MFDLSKPNFPHITSKPEELLYEDRSPHFGTQKNNSILFSKGSKGVVYKGNLCFVFKEEDTDTKSVSAMLVEKLPVFVQSADLEVQERVSDRCQSFLELM